MLGTGKAAAPPLLRKLLLMREFGFSWEEVNTLPWDVLEAARIVSNVEAEAKSKERTK